jgi:hypothetical protein
MPASGPHPRSHGHRRVDRNIDAPERATHPTRIVATRVQKGSAMDVIDRAEQEPEPMSVARCRELLGDDADMMSDEEILAVARHAETLAHVLIAVALQDVRVH